MFFIKCKRHALQTRASGVNGTSIYPRQQWKERYFFFLGLNSIGLGIDISFMQSIANLSVIPDI